MYKVEDDSLFWLSIPPIFDPSLMKFTPTMYVTARPIHNDISTLALKIHGFPTAPVITVGHGNSKVNALKGKVDVFVEDAVHNFEELNNNNILCYLCTRSHNKDYDAKDLRVNNLLDFQDKVLTIR